MQRTTLAALSLLTLSSTVFACSASDSDTTDGEDTANTDSVSSDIRRSHRDAGTSTADSGATKTDAGSATGSDAGSTKTDAGSTTSDSGSGTTTPPSSGSSASLGGCNMYPADNAWNRDVSKDAVHANSATYIANMAPTGTLHADWGTSSEEYGMPINIGHGSPAVPITYTTSWGNSESDKLACASGGNFCYPIPLSSKIEGGASASTDDDRHLLYLDTTGAPSNCTLYELYNTQNQSGAGFTAGNGAIFHLGSDALRPDGWTSGDAAGLPIMPGLVRYDEIVAGEIKHAIRFTMKSTQQAYIHPATHAAGKVNASLPPMGLRVRLKSSVNISGASAGAQVVLKAMKTYGLILADNGSNWYVTGDMNDGWSGVQSGIQSALSQVHGSDFEAVESGPLSTNNL